LLLLFTFFLLWLPYADLLLPGDISQEEGIVAYDVHVATRIVKFAQASELDYYNIF
jgi:hypothetical protein